MRFLSAKVHTIIGLVVGVALLVAPNIFGFAENEAASLIARIIGAVILVSELVTTSRFSLLKLVPMRVHLFMDYLVGLVLALSPWLFGFADTEANVWVPHLVVGLLVIGYAAATDPDDESTDTVVG